MQTQLATFGSGCFWCTEAIFKDLRGVVKVTSGYSGGINANPTYDQVSTGGTGHAEAVQVEFDPSVISFEQLAEVFFLTHDPTQLNRQGNDVGDQYRSVIFTHDPGQQQQAASVMARIQAEGVYDKPIVTQIVPYTNFFPAEDYHQNYFENNPEQPYCQVVINPKVAKFRKKFAALRKN